MMTQWASKSLPTNGGNGSYSYMNNSYYQRLAVDVVKSKIEEAIQNKLDLKHIVSPTRRTICVADLGCAAGPNTIISMQNIIDCIENKRYSELLSSAELDTNGNNIDPLEFTVFFNDLPSNDFNTLFTNLPQDRHYYAAGVPGSFHGRLFPESSLHFVYSAVALHWLSKVPEVLLDEKSPAWNPTRVHYTNAPAQVVDAYRAQFASDLEGFLSARAKEMVVGGLMVILMAGIPYGMPHSEVPAGVMYHLLSSCLMEMAQEGVITEGEVESFNLPIYSASCEEVSEIVEQNGCFSIEEMELTNPSPWLDNNEEAIDMEAWTNHVRAAMEGLFVAHFGGHVVDEIFHRLVEKLKEQAQLVESSYRDKIMLFAILKRC